MKKYRVIFILMSIVFAILLLLQLQNRRASEFGKSESSLSRRLADQKEVESNSVVYISTQSITKQEANKEERHQAKLLKEIAELAPSAHINAIIGVNVDKNDRNARREAVNKLTKLIPNNDVQALRLFLNFRTDDNQELKPLTFNGIKNDVLDVLLRQKQIPEGIGLDMVRMFRDEKHDDIWRDYCLQYFALYYERKWPQKSPAAENEEVVSMKEAYWDSIEMKDKNFAGTALLALEDLSSKRKEFDREKIEKTIVDLANDDSCNEASRITTFSIATKLQKVEVLPSARIIAQAGESTMLRCAAIAALGEMGQEEDIELIESLQASEDKRIQKIASSALEKLNASK